ncbi:P-selectin-like [Anneissia japonica]|uniref:P-selectin-like n=1 Tax=Anneissia japonica TaxID=1529436 RepID=UPI0014259810|nr:P-selectin-like [Anneissia japonica]
MTPAGPTCYEVDECLSNPCAELFVCLNKVNRYVCKAPCSSPLTPTNGMFTLNDPEMKHDTIASFSCEPMYTISGSSTTTCSNGQWTHSFPECKAPCDTPTAPTHGSFTVNDNEMKHNSEASFFCDPLYTLVGSSTSRCSNGSWDVFPECKAPCESPIVPTNGSFTVNDVQLKHNTEASFSCATRFTINGSSTSRCSDGSWDTDFPECIGRPNVNI